jgi:hypothetical protein
VKWRTSAGEIYLTDFDRGLSAWLLRVRRWRVFLDLVAVEQDGKVGGYAVASRPGATLTCVARRRAVRRAHQVAVGSTTGMRSAARVPSTMLR